MCAYTLIRFDPREGLQVRSRIYFENLVEDTIVTNFPSTESLLRKIIVQILASSKFAHGTIQGRFRDRYVESGSKSCKRLRPLPPSLWLASSDVSRGATRIRDEDNIRGASRYRRGRNFVTGQHPSRDILRDGGGPLWLGWVRRCLSRHWSAIDPPFRLRTRPLVRDSSFYFNNEKRNLPRTGWRRGREFENPCWFLASVLIEKYNKTRWYTFWKKEKKKTGTFSP